MKKLFPIILLLFIGLTACEKEESKEPNIEPTEDIIEIKTSFGNIYIWLNKKTPLHRENFIKLARENFFDQTLFHRCASNFVIQGGDPNTKDSDPTNDGKGGPGYKLPSEIDSSIYKHDYGAVGAARDNNPLKESNGSQFYIVTQTGGSHSLDNNYTVFGKVIKGMEIALTINKQPKTGEVPKTPIPMDVNVLTKTVSEIMNEYNYTDLDW